MNQKTKRLVSAYIDIQAEEGKSAEDIVRDCERCGISRKDLADSGLLVGSELTSDQITSTQSHSWNLSMLAAKYAAACGLAGYEQADVADAFARMGFTRDELSNFGLSLFCMDDGGNDDDLDGFDENDKQQGATSSVDIANMRGMPRQFSFEDYTLEECQFCESEVVIRATGISICPKCKRPILPCTKCSSCTSPCPYDYTGRFGLRQRPTNPLITKEETEFYLKELERRKHQ